MTAVARHRQRPISFRSDKAAALLARLTRNGRSQAQVIEDALEKAAQEAPPITVEEKIARIDAVLSRVHGLGGRSRQEIEDEMYDENGVPR